MLHHEKIGELTCYQFFTMQSTWSNGGNKQKEFFFKNFKSCTKLFIRYIILCMNLHYIYNVAVLIQSRNFQFQENLDGIFPWLTVSDVMNFIN